MTREWYSEGWAVDKLRMVSQIKPKYRNWTPGVTGTIDRDKYNRNVIDPYDYEPLHRSIADDTWSDPHMMSQKRLLSSSSIQVVSKTWQHQAVCVFFESAESDLCSLPWIHNLFQSIVNNCWFGVFVRYWVSYPIRGDDDRVIYFIQWCGWRQERASALRTKQARSPCARVLLWIDFCVRMPSHTPVYIEVNTLA